VYGDLNMILNSAHRKLFAILAIALIYVTYASIADTIFADEAKDDVLVAVPQAMVVDTVIVEVTSSRLWREFSGHLAAVNFVEIRPQISGIITKVNFKDGQFVNKGDVLYIIDPKPLASIVAQKEASLNTARNNYSLAQKELKRSTNLLAKKMISEQIHDESVNKKLITHSAIKEAEAALLEAKINLTYTSIEAPISGQINRTELTQGNLVDAGIIAPLLTSVVSQGRIYADFEIDENTYIEYLQSSFTSGTSLEATPVELRLQSNDIVFNGTVHSVDNRIDPSTGTISIRAIFENLSKLLVPGMFAQIKLSSTEVHKQILISEHAIGTDQNRKFVYVVSNENMATYREVTLGDSIKGYKVVTSGLNQGDEVITSGVLRIRPNTLVSPKDSSTNAIEK
jgi:multidrug efflux system membrane fusion protein